jgi:anthranilate/para-aminobenzoate synthase component II
MHGKISAIACNQSGIFEGLPKEIEVVRYHSLILEAQEGNDLAITAQTSEGEIMGLRHAHKPIWGIQFHPEAALTQYGHEMIANWVKSLR